MPDIVYGRAAYRRDNGNLPELKLKNMFLEASVTGDQGAILLSRKGLSSFTTVGTGPITGLYSEENVFSGDVFCVSGGILYRGAAALGGIGGTGPVSFAAGLPNELVVCAGASIYKYNGVSLTTVAFPDSDNVSYVIFHDGHYIAAVSGSDRWYWSNALDAGTWEALSFATAEARPDTLKTIRVIGDFLFLIGAATIERWANTGDANLPYSRVEGAIIQRGARSTGCAVVIDDTIVFVGSDGVVYQLTDGLTRLSDNGIEERISSSVSTSAFTFVHEGHKFYCLRLDTGTFVLDTTTGQWCEFTSYGLTNWRAQTACTSGLTVLLGDAVNGTVWKLSGWQDGTDPIERLFTAAFPLEGGVLIVDRLGVEINSGWTSFLAGQGSNPQIEMRKSVDAGATWSNWRSSPMGQQGKYRTKAEWRRCGMFDAPGGIFEIRVTDPVSVRVSRVTINEPGGGIST